MLKALRIIPLAFVALLVIVISQASARDYTWENNPLVIYGNNPALANNIVLMIDDNVYEYNIRHIFEMLQERGIHAVFFPHTRYMLNQDPQLWRDIVAAGHEIGYFTRNHEHDFTAEEFAADYALYMEELRGILNDPNYTIRYAKPACWDWEDSWFEWLESTDLRAVRANILGPAEIEYFNGVFTDTSGGGHLMSVLSFTEHMDWLEANLDALMQLTTPDGQPYRWVNLTEALND